MYKFKKKFDWIRKENYQNMQKLPEVSDRKKGRRMREKKGPSDRGSRLTLFQAVTGELTTLCWLVAGATHTSLDETLVNLSPSNSPLGQQYAEI